MTATPAITVRRLLGAALLLATALSARVEARGLSYGAVTDPGLQRCDALQDTGKRQEAISCWRALLNTASPAVQAEVAWALGDYRSAGQLFQGAARTRADDAMLRVRWGELFVDTHQDDEAYKLFLEALKLDEDNAWARINAASVLIGQYSQEAGEYLDAVLKGSAPAGAQLRAQLLAARVALEDGSDLDAAEDLLKKAMALASANNLPKQEVHALQAALAQIRNENNAASVQAALQENPRYGGVYLALAHFHDIRRRYDEATLLNAKALEVQPDLWDAHVKLGTGLMRDNRFSEARTHFEAAFKGDPYNPVTVNTLRLLDAVARFDTLVYPEPVANAAVAPQIIVRMNKRESAVLAPYVRKLAEQSISSYSQRYRFQLRKPVVIEIYNNHEDFAVRTAGMPGLGLLGVTFGHVVAMDSPSSRAVNDFHWGSTLWHELAHVYTLESTDHLVPRWLSEGLSVYEEWRTGPTRGVNIPLFVYSALAAGKALPIAELDRGFIRPEYEQQVHVSYTQAGLTCDFIAQRWGFDKLVDMLGQFKRGAPTGAAVQAAIGISPEAFDRQFGEWLRSQYGAVFAGLRPLGDARAAARKAVTDRNWNAAVAAAQTALKILPNDVEDGSPYLPLANAQQSLGQEDAARETLQQYWQRGGYDPQALGMLAQLYYKANRKGEAVAVMQSINYVAPFDYSQHGQMGDWLLELNRPGEALQEFQVALALNPPDQAIAHYRLARAHYALKSNAEARRALLRALEIAPSYRPAQQLLLELAGSQPRT